MPTKIEWTDETWNPITGCTKISDGCKNCYAERMSKRLAGRFGYPKDNPFKVTFHKDKIDVNMFRPGKRVFVCSMSDIFHDDVKPEWQCDIWDVMNAHKDNIFLLLTKRPENAPTHESWWPSNIWLGVTVESNKYAHRIETLLQIPAAVRFVSHEPALGKLDLFYKLSGIGKAAAFPDWLITGGESGPGARPMHPDIPRHDRDQCEAAGVPYFFKQWGEWSPVHGRRGHGKNMRICRVGKVEPFDYTEKTLPTRPFDMFGTTCVLGNFGKKVAGHLLDGKEYREWPKGAI